MLAFFIGGAKLDLEGSKNCEEHKYRVNIGVLTPSSAWSFHLFKHYQPAQIFNYHENIKIFSSH